MTRKPTKNPRASSPGKSPSRDSSAHAAPRTSIASRGASTLGAGDVQARRGRGRPKGSRNKTVPVPDVSPTTEPERATSKAVTPESSPFPLSGNPVTADKRAAIAWSILRELTCVLATYTTRETTEFHDLHRVDPAYAGKPVFRRYADLDATPQAPVNPKDKTAVEVPPPRLASATTKAREKVHPVYRAELPDLNHWAEAYVEGPAAYLEALSEWVAAGSVVPQGGNALVAIGDHFSRAIRRRILWQAIMRNGLSLTRAAEYLGLSSASVAARTVRELGLSERLERARASAQHVPQHGVPNVHGRSQGARGDS